MENIRVWDPGWKKFGSGNRDKHPGSATLAPTKVFFYESGFYLAHKLHSFPFLKLMSRVMVPVLVLSKDNAPSYGTVRFLF
jgi:hypothetical protein